MPDSGPANAVVTIRLVYLARLRDAFGSAATRHWRCCPPSARSPTCCASCGLGAARWSVELAPQRAVRVAVNHRWPTPTPCSATATRWPCCRPSPAADRQESAMAVRVQTEDFDVAAEIAALRAR